MTRQGALALFAVALFSMFFAACQRSANDAADAAIGGLNQDLDASLLTQDAGASPGSSLVDAGQGMIDAGLGAIVPDASSGPDIPDAGPFSMDAGRL